MKAKQLVGIYRKKYGEHKGITPYINWGAEIERAKRLLNQLETGELINCLDLYLKETDKWYAQAGWPLSIFETRINYLRLKLQKKNKKEISDKERL